MTEEDLKYKITYQNLLLYSLVLPSQTEEGKSNDTGETVDMFDFFNGLGGD